MGNQTKRFTQSAKNGIRAESLFESLVIDYVIPRKIGGAIDLGVDYICEWVNNDNPSGILFNVQVKSCTGNPFEKIEKKCDNGFSSCYKENSKRTSKWIQPKDKEYLTNMQLPAYLFVVANIETDSPKIFYLRLTPILFGKKKNFKNQYYFHCNEDGKFSAFIDQNKGGFARDLFIDATRISYNQGNLFFKNPRELGLNDFDEQPFFKNMALNEYKSNILKNIKIFDELKKQFENSKQQQT